jgi:hypothetical protein
MEREIRNNLQGFLDKPCMNDWQKKQLLVYLTLMTRMKISKALK